MLVAKKLWLFLSQQNIFVTTKLLSWQIFVATTVFIATKLLSRQAYFCATNNVFVATKVTKAQFCHDKIIIIIMYIYHALIKALSTHMIHMIFYTHVEHSPTKTIYIKYYIKLKISKIKKRTTHARTHARTHTHTHTDCSRNWVLILVRMETLLEEEGFQFGFKRWHGWAVSKILWDWIPNVGSKAREGAKTISLAFVLLDFQHAGVRRRA